MQDWTATLQVIISPCNTYYEGVGGKSQYLLTVTTTETETKESKMTPDRSVAHSVQRHSETKASG